MQSEKEKTHTVQAMIEECRDKQRQAEQERDYALSHQKKVEIPVEKPVLYQKCQNCNQTAYLKANYPQKMEIYAGAFKKWADNIIANGVPHNNWNLLQARFIMNVGLVLEDNKEYADGKGREYYIDYVMNRSSIRQWSLTRLAEYGFGSKTGIWAECPGYSSVVINDYANFVNQFDNNLRYDLVKAMPVLSKAVATTPQYLFPNRMICGFGDTHPGYLNTNFFVRMIQNAQANGKKEQEDGK